MSQQSHTGLSAVGAALTVISGLALGAAADLRSVWPPHVARTWVGPEYWANRLQDWRVANGRLECVTSGGDRNVHLLTRQLGAGKGDVRMSVRLGRLDRKARLTPGWVGFRVGIKGQWNDYRDSVRRGKGLDVGVTTRGELFIGGTRSLAPTLPHRGISRDKGRQPKPAQPTNPIPLDDVQLRLSAEPEGNRYKLTLAAHDPGSGQRLGEVSRAVAPEQLVGNLALVCDARPRGRRRQLTGGAVRFWFRDWQVGGAKVEAHPERAFGPILWAQHTLSRGVLTMTAQMPPIGPKDAQTVRLQIQRDGKWATVAEAPIHPLARIATFRIRDWQASRDWPYRVAYALRMSDGSTRDHYWGGTIRKDPADKPTIVVAAFTGNADYAFPNTDLVRHVTAHNPDVLFFSGDNIYENVGGYGCQRAPLDQAVLDYLRKWYFFGWAYASVLRDRPCVSIPDDHDVYQGNVWGHGGRKAPHGQNSGGYTMPAEWVKMVERTQTSNLPPPFDPTPIGQGIGVYYTHMVYGRVSFAVIEDRKFKTGPQGLVPKTRSGRTDHVANGSFDAKAADVPGARLLGDRQLRFLRAWAADWRGADMKCALSQTTFCNAATLHGAGLRRLVADYDSNGWPQTGRNKAVHELRRGFAFHIGGDQHLATIVHHGIGAWNDATWSFCVPSIANFYPRAWVPLKPAHNWTKGMIEHTGEFHDGFGNRITLYAHTNPRPMGKEPAAIHDRMPGYGIVRFHKPTRRITMECWPLFADPRHPRTGGQYRGWPKTIHQLDCYGRKATAWLPTLKFAGIADPVVQIIDEADGDVVYTLRVRGDSFSPKVFRPGAYTVRVGELGTQRTKMLKGIRSLGPDKKGTIRIEF